MASNKEVAKADPAAAEVVTEQILLDFLETLPQALNDKEKRQFINTAQAFNLNPFKREIHCNLYTKEASGNYPAKRSLSVIVGYEVYIKRADRSGKLDGWETEFMEANGELWSCIITIWRKDQSRPFKWEVFFSEQAQYTKAYNNQPAKLTQFWEKKYQQLRKVAISQGFRLCFPDENGGIPYTSDEMPQNEVQDTTAEVVHSEIADPKEEAKPEKKAKKEPTPKYPDAPEMTELELYNSLYKEIDGLSSYTELGNIEDRIGLNPALDEMNRIALLKHSISRRAELITSVDMATQTAVRLKNMMTRIGQDNVTPLFSEIIDACALVRISYGDDKKFHKMPDIEEQVPESEQTL